MKNMHNKGKIRNLKKPYVTKDNVILFIIQEESFLYSYF